MKNFIIVIKKSITKFNIKAENPFKTYIGIKMKTKICFFFISFSILLSGCAQIRTDVNVDTSYLTLKSPQSSSKSVFIRSLEDNRKFVPGTKDPSVPSLKPVNKNAQDHMIGRKRSAFGAAIGWISLVPEQTVTDLIRKIIAQSYIDNGFQVVSDKGQINSNTINIDISINKLWAWMDLGAWTATGNHEIEVDLTDNKGTFTIYSKHSEELFMDYDWPNVFSPSFRKFCDKARETIDIRYKN